MSPNLKNKMGVALKKAFPELKNVEISAAKYNHKITKLQYVRLTLAIIVCILALPFQIFFLLIHKCYKMIGK